MRAKEDERRLGLSQEPGLPVSCGTLSPAPPTHLIDRALHDRIVNDLLDQRRDLVAALAGLLGLCELVASRSDVSPEIRWALKRNHRFAEAEAVLARTYIPNI